MAKSYFLLLKKPLDKTGGKNIFYYYSRNAADGKIYATQKN